MLVMVLGIYVPGKIAQISHGVQVNRMKAVRTHRPPFQCSGHIAYTISDKLSD
jgi:hypothetical protein